MEEEEGVEEVFAPKLYGDCCMSIENLIKNRKRKKKWKRDGIIFKYPHKSKSS